MSPTRRQILLASCATIALTPLSAHARRVLRPGGSTAPGSSQSINSISLSNDTFINGSPSGTVVGTVMITLNPLIPGPTAPPTLSGTNASDFRLVGRGAIWSLETVGSLPNNTTFGPFNVNYAQAGLTNTRQSIAVTVMSQADIFPTEMTVTNNSGTTMPAGVPTQTFGQPFRQGDIPAGMVPKFTVSGVTQTYSVGLPTYWADGSLKFASFMLLPTFSVPGNSSQAVTLTAVSGSFPGPSGRTLSEVHSQSIVVNAPAYPSGHNARTGTVQSFLDGGSLQIGNAVVWLDGAAGTAWKITTNMTLSGSGAGAADGQLVFDHYVIALNNSGGTLGGFRWYGCIRQPWYNNDTPAKSYVYFTPPNYGSPASGVNWQYGSGPTVTPLTWKGNDGNPFGPIAFSNGGAFTGSINSSGVMTVSAMTADVIPTNAINGANCWLEGSGVVPSTYNVASQLTGVNFRGGSTGARAILSGNTLTIDQNYSFAIRNGDTVTEIATGVGSNSAIPLGTTIVSGGPGTGHAGDVFIISHIYPPAITQTLFNVVFSDVQPGLTGTYQLGGGWSGTLASQELQAFNTNGENGGTLLLGTNNWFTGAGNGNIYPAIVTGSSLPPTSTPGTGPVAWADGAPCFIYTFSSDPSQFTVSVSSATNVSFTFSGYGSGTMQLCPGLYSFNRINFLGPDGKYNFFKGTGSISSETTLRNQFVPQYWAASRVIPPWDTSVTGSSWPTGDKAINDIAYSFPWSPYYVTDQRTAQQAAGDATDIGWINNNCILDFYNQSQNSELAMRSVGMAASLCVFDFKDKTTNTIVPVNNPSLGPYTGMPSSSRALDTEWGPANFGAPFHSPGFSAPAAGCNAIGYGPSYPEHFPNYAYFPYLRTGEMQYLDFNTEAGNAPVMSADLVARNPSSDTSTSNNGTGGVYSSQAFGLVNWNVGEFRTTAWATRDMNWAAHIYPWNPTTGFDTVATTFSASGNQIGAYLKNIADVQSNFFYDQWLAGATIYGAAWTYIHSVGYWGYAQTGFPGGPTQLTYNYGCEFWELSYFVGSMCIAAMRGNTKAQNWLLETTGKFWNHVGTAFAGSSSNGFYFLSVIGQLFGLDSNNLPATGFATSPTTSDLGFGVHELGGVPTGTWTNTSPAFTANMGGFLAPMLTDGSKFLCSSENPGGPPSPIPGGLSINTAYYSINTNNSNPSACTFDFTTVKGDPSHIVVPTDTGVWGQNQPSQFYWIWDSPVTNNANNPQYCQNLRAASAWARALGLDPNRWWLSVFNDSTFRLVSQGLPAHGYLNGSLGTYSGTDARYCLTDKFG